MTNDFTGEFSMEKSADRPVTDDEMPDGVRAQPGIGDLEEQFRQVTRGFDDMHKRVMPPSQRDPMLSLSSREYYDDIQQDAGEAAMEQVDDLNSAEFDPVDGEFRRFNPMGSVADIDPKVADIAGHEFDDGGEF